MSRTSIVSITGSLCSLHSLWSLVFHSHFRLKQARRGTVESSSGRHLGYIHATVPGGRKVQPYTCTSTAISLAGRVCYSRFTPNKAINVLSNVIEAYGLVRKHVGQEMLLRMEVDNGAHDVVAHISSSPSLLNDV
mmetsp:Transcript_2564/g.5673  ORF Transcript_2564/g.5673 Transcript_2564/m.5673 type:complete len:135 (+) Transcript_2564:1458-1862(+)